MTAFYVGMTFVLVLVFCYLIRVRNHRHPSSIAKYADSVLQDMGIYVCLVNQRIEVVKTNYFTLSEGTASKHLVGLGKMIPCKNATGEGLCGRSEVCEACPVSRQVIRAFQTHRNFKNLEVSLQMSAPNQNEVSGSCDVIVSGRLLTWLGKEYLLLTIRDITYVKSIERDLAAVKSRMTIQERDNHSFVAGIGVDIQSSLNSVIAYTDLFLVSAETERRAAYLEQVRHHNLLLRGMMGDVLDYTRLEMGRLELVYTKENLTGLMYELESACWLYNETGKNQYQLILSSVPAECWGVIEKRRIMQILLHFFMLVMKNMPEGCISFGYTVSESDEACFFIRFQKGTVSQEEFELRMSLNHRLIDLMKGSMGMDNDDPNVSILWVRIPFKPAAGDELQLLKKGRKCLLVATSDDEWFVRMESVLRNTYSINRVVDGESLVLDYLRLRPDAIVTFTDLPKVSGVLAKDAVRLMSRTIPIVGICYEKLPGFTAVLSEDCSSSDLLQILSTLGV